SYEESNEDDFRAAGLTAIVRKPFDATDIVMQVKKVLGYEFARRRPAAATNAPSSSRVLDGLTASMVHREHPDLPAVGPIVGRVQDWEPQINAELHDLAAEHQALAST